MDITESILETVARSSAYLTVAVFSFEIGNVDI